jgi:hypothetical protein
MNAHQSSVVPPKDQTRLRIERMEADREERRRAMIEVRTTPETMCFCDLAVVPSFPHVT